MDKFSLFAALLVAFLAGMAYMATLPGNRRNSGVEREKKPKKIAFSKLIAAGVLAVDGYATYRVLALCELAILSNFSGALPYLTALIGALQAATAYILGHYPSIGWTAHHRLSILSQSIRTQGRNFRPHLICKH